MPTPTLRSSRPVRRALTRAPHRVARTRAAALSAAVAVATGLLVGLAGPAAAAPKPPPNPSDAQLGSAEAQKTALATQVGALTAQLSQQKLRVQELQGLAELAEQKYAYALQKLDEATTAAATAKQDVAAAQAAVEKAHAAFDASVRANYTQGGLQGGPGALLAAGDPDQVLQSSAFQAYVSDHQADGIGQLDRAKVAKANADAAARTAVATQAQLTAAAEQADEDARAAQAVAESQQQALASQQADTQTQLSTAYNHLQSLLGLRQTYNQYVAEQVRIAAEKERQRQAALIAQQKAAAAKLAAQQAARQQSGGGSGGGSTGGGSSGGGSTGGGGAGSGDPSGGSWSAAKGQAAVSRAMPWINQPYAYAAGNYNGPTYGVCQSGAAYNDCHVYGFDCSGLVLYAWAPYIHLDHYSVTQYSQAGSYHPGTGDLMPGDLLFYGYSRSTIHHVAMYIGNGNVIQAPQSGDHVRVTSIWNMGSDYYGATRPLT